MLELTIELGVLFKELGPALYLMNLRRHISLYVQAEISRDPWAIPAQPVVAPARLHQTAKPDPCSSDRRWRRTGVCVAVGCNREAVLCAVRSQLMPVLKWRSVALFLDRMA